MTRPAYLISAFRTPVMPKGGAYHRLDVHQLAAPVMTGCLQGISAPVEQVILGNALYGGGNPARRSLLAAGLGEHLSGITIDSQCASGIDAILLARDMVASGAANLVLAGGAESYSRRPQRWRTDANGGPAQPYDQPAFTPWPDRDPMMHQAAADLAETLNIARAEQEAWAIKSHANAKADQTAFVREMICPLGQQTKDGFARNLTARLCARAPVVAGTITSATAAIAADAAAFVLVGSEEIICQSPFRPIEILQGKTVGGDPQIPGLVPVAAIKAVLEKARILVADLSYAEIMEAYAVQAMACVRLSGIDPTIVNQKGGALARGHPIGASGTILAVRLFHDLQTRPGLGLAAIAAAGGLGSAVLLRSTI